MTTESYTFPASFAQQRLWFLEQLAPQGSVYNVALAFGVNGRLDLHALEQSLNAVIRRHESLRTTFTLQDGTLMQVIEREPSSIARAVDLSEGNNQTQLMLEEVERPFNLVTGPLLRVSVLRSSVADTLVITMHHIITDGWSGRILMKELAVFYESFHKGVEFSLPELPIQYADFAVWQRQQQETEALKSQVEYWLDHLHGAPALLELGTDRPRPAVQGMRGARVHRRLSPTLTAKLRELSRAHDATVFMTLLAAFAVALYRNSGEPDVVIGTPVAARGLSEVEGLIGFFANTLALRLDLSGTPGFKELVRRVRDMTLEAHANQEVPFDKLVEELQPERSLSYAPVFQVMFAYDNSPSGDIKFGDVALHPLDIERVISKFDLTLHAHDNEKGISFTLEYSIDLFDEASADRIISHLANLLELVTEQSETSIDDLDILEPGERRQLLSDWNATQVDYPRVDLIHRLIEGQVEKSAESTAVLFEDQSLTYFELNTRANQLAACLRRAGVGPESLVGVFMDRSLELVVALLGIMKAGGAYVPLDPAYPRERLEWMVSDGKLETILTSAALADSAPGGAANLIPLDSCWPVIAKEDGVNSDAKVSLDSLAYVIYTSGSTGKPKGTMNTHRGLCNRLNWMQQAYELTGGDRVLQKTPYSFDVSVWEFFWPLLTGAQLVMARPGGHQDPTYLVETIQQYSITTLHFVPSMLQAFLEDDEVAKCVSIRQVISSGEALSIELQERFFARLDAALHNLYGPTEASIDVTFWECRKGETRSTVPIGRPIANTRMYVLTGALQPAPINVPGELCIGGIGLGRGYLHRPDLTAEKFIPDPFDETAGSRMYRTGDVGRWRADGAIEYLGRSDHQVKIRGIRIELGEIETAINQHPAVNDSVVLVSGDSQNSRRLVAYVVPGEDRAFTVRQLLKLERAGLPEGGSVWEMPNGMPVVFRNRGETEFVYDEIFRDQSYLKHGITLSEQSCVFDVGANIGLFTLFVGQAVPGARVYAFEPIPPLFDLLKVNASLYGFEVVAFSCGLSNENRSVDFTYYPHASVMSGRFADPAAERETVAAYVLNQRRAQGGAEFSRAELDALLEERLESETFTCALRTLSDVMRESGVENIDLLKVDVEKSELDVLLGIEPQDWSKIRQIVVEVHDTDGRLNQITGLLASHGYELTVDQDALLKDTKLYNVYARRSLMIMPASDSGITGEPGFLNRGQLIADIKSSLKERLPEYMVPATFVLLDSLPLNANGKLDRRALPAPDTARLDRRAEFAAPRTNVEKVLAEIWAEVLGLAKASVNDNFFDLGGDSIMSMQIVSRARKVGLHLTPKHIFQRQTVAELAAVVDTTSFIEAEQGIVTGRVPLTPVQHWFFEMQLTDVNHFNQSALIESAEPLEGPVLAAAVDALLKHHDALRLRFVLSENVWQQLNAGEEIEDIVAHHDLSGLSDADQASAIEAAMAELHRTLNIFTGPMIRVGWFDFGAQAPSRLFIVIHHLAVDGVSWRILIEDLQTAYRQLNSGVAIQLPAKTTAFRTWSERLQQYARSEATLNELDYWLSSPAGEVRKLPVDYSQDNNVRSSAATLSMSLSAETSSALLHSVPAAFGTQINDVLLAALMAALGNWVGEGPLPIDVEGHGREEIVEGVDLSRTVGWFTTIFPVWARNTGSDEVSLLKSVRDQLRAQPNRGIGYGVLRYLADDEIRAKFDNLPSAEVLFNYLGRFNRTAESWRPIHGERGQHYGPTQERSHLLEIGCRITDERLRVEWTFSKNVHRRETIQTLAESLVSWLEKIVELAASPTPAFYLPSDFPDVELNQQELVDILAEIE